VPSSPNQPRARCPIRLRVATVMGAMLLALACVAWLLFFIHHISQAISVSNIVDRIATEMEAMIDEMMPWPHRPDALPDPHLFGTGHLGNPRTQAESAISIPGA
jgi:hypothetical protein